MRRRKNYLLRVLVCVFSVPTVAMITGALEKPTVWDAAAVEALKPWLTAGALTGAAHLLLRPVLRLLSAPIGCLTLGLFGFVIDIAILLMCMQPVSLQPALGDAALMAIVINILCAVVG